MTSTPAGANAGPPPEGRWTSVCVRFCETGIDAVPRLDLPTTAVRSSLRDSSETGREGQWIFDDFVDKSQPADRVNQRSFPAIVGEVVAGAGSTRQTPSQPHDRLPEISRIARMHSKTRQLVNSRTMRRLAVAAVCLSTAITTGGCRSATPSWSSFGFKREPSPDTIAGIGPTTTYPLSPSATATPSPINSIAASPAGVQPQTSQVATTGPAGQPTATTAGGANTLGTNPAAAVANGYPGTVAATSTAGAAQTSPASAYALGGNPATPGGFPSPATPTTAPTYATTPPASQADKSTYAAVGYPLPGSHKTLPTTPTATAQTTPPPATATPPTTAPGFALPPAAVPSLAVKPETNPATTVENTPGVSTPPSIAAGFAMPPVASTAPPSSTGSAGGFVMPDLGVAASEPEAKTAAAAPAPTPTATAPGTIAPVSGYAPGSTSGATSYPATQAGSDTDSDSSGSFYR